MINYTTNLSNSSNQFSVPTKLPCLTINNVEYPINLGINHHLPPIITLIIIALITIVFNGTFLFVAFKSQRIRTLHNILLISLAITDLFTGVVVTPIHAILYIFLMNAKYPCGLFWSRPIAFYAVSIISFSTLALISLEKYLAIIHTYYYQQVITKRKLILMAVAVWVFGTTFSTVSHLIALSHYKIYQLLWFTIPYLGIIFYIAIFYCYGKIFQEIRKVKRRIRVENIIPNNHTSVRESSKAAKITTMVIGALTLCYLPLFTVYILWGVAGKLVSISRSLEVLIKKFAYIIILFNSTLNPVIYYVRMSLVRREFKRIFCLS